MQEKNKGGYFMKVEKIGWSLLAFLVVAVFTYGLMQIQSQTVEVNASEYSGNLSNTKIGWGLKRNQNHKQPDLGSKNKELIDECGGIAMGNKDKPYLYLTFDEGYEAGYTSQILDILKENNVTATFFITAHYLNTNEDLVKRMIEEGHIVGNHTVNHKSMPDLSDEEVKEEVLTLHQAVYNKFEYEMKYIRPPKGEYSQRTLDLCKKQGYTTTMWSFAYFDYDEKKQPSEEKARKMILDNLHNGEVMLLHGNSKTNVAVLDTVIKEAKEQGYEWRSLDDFER